MKATSFQKPFEYTLKIDGESWAQGETLTGTLEVKNHAGSPPPEVRVHLHLAKASLKDVRQKSEGAFDVAATASDETWVLPQAGASMSYPFRFELDRNAPITDSSSSLFLIYGHAAALEQLGQIQLKVTPEPTLAEVIETLKVQFRFVLKTQRAAKAGTESKLVPPDSRPFSSLEHLMLTGRYEGETLHLKYVFHVKSTEATAAGVSVKKSKVELEQELSAVQYRTPSGRFNHEFIEEKLREALQLVESKTFF